jgi:hypothetical protein
LLDEEVKSPRRSPRPAVRLLADWAWRVRLLDAEAKCRVKAKCGIRTGLPTYHAAHLAESSACFARRPVVPHAACSTLSHTSTTPGGSRGGSRISLERNANINRYVSFSINGWF